MKITKKWLMNQDACESGLMWFEGQDETDAHKVCLALVEQGHVDWARWLLVRCLTKEQNQQVAIYAAELVLPMYEQKYPGDWRVRHCIKATKTYLLGHINRAELKEARAAAAAAADSAYGAAAGRKIMTEIINFAFRMKNEKGSR